MGYKSSKCCADTLIVRDRSLQQSDDLRDRHRLRIGITGSPTQPQQETAVSGDAIAHLAEPREVDKKSFLEEGRKGGVQIGRLREPPQFVDHERSIRSGAEKVWHQAKARRDLTFKSFLRGLLRPPGFGEKGGYRHCSPLVAARMRIDGVGNVADPVGQCLSTIAHLKL